MAYYSVDYAVNTLAIGKAVHSSRSASYFSEGSFYGISGAHFDAVCCRAVHKAKQFIQVFLDAVIDDCISNDTRVYYNT